jgi:hypothetical protein
VAFIVLSHRLARDPRWHPLAGNTLATGVLGVVMVLATIVLVFSDAGPLHDVGGLVQRLTLARHLLPLSAAAGPAVPDCGSVAGRSDRRERVRAWRD